MRGLPIRIQGLEEQIQRVLIRLTVPKGSFPLDPSLGSELYALGSRRRGERAQTALLFARDALSPLEGVQAVDAEVGEDLPTGALNLTFFIEIDGALKSVVIDI